jgi:hypothetical protein
MEAVDEVLKRSTRVLVDSSDKGLSSVTPYMSVTEPRPVRMNPPPSMLESQQGAQARGAPK